MNKQLYKQFINSNRKFETQEYFEVFEALRVRGDLVEMIASRFAGYYGGANKDVPIGNIINIVDGLLENDLIKTEKTSQKLIQAYIKIDLNFKNHGGYYRNRE